MIRLTFALLLVMATLAWAQEHQATAGAEASMEHADASHVDATAHPTLPQASNWPFQVVVVILAMFAMAAVIGPSARANMDEDLPPTHSHDEPPGTSGHHGASGTIDTDDHGHAPAHH